MMKLLEIIEKYEKIVPKNIQWEKDNTGLQIGDPESEISKILLCLEVTDKIVQEAINENIDLIFSHHPMLFFPLKKIDSSTKIGNIVYKLINNNISLYSSHTNLDKIKEGTSYSLSEKLGLQKIELLNNDPDLYYKIATFVPPDYVEKVTEALMNAGAGKVGKYDYCSFRTKGQGTFRGSEDTNPFIGKKGEKEYVDEVRLETIFPKWATSNIIIALKSSHPYEEVAYDIYPLKNQSTQYGIGTIGETREEMKATDFLDLLKKIINAPFLKISGDYNRSIKRVAVVAGAGSQYLNEAIAKKADIFITSDLTYHNFFETQNLIIVDAGHYETEITVLENLENLLRSIFNKNIEIIKTEITTNPITFY
jgi:dinuclear metal center YbgI/SA1388 family protein